MSAWQLEKRKPRRHFKRYCLSLGALLASVSVSGVAQAYPSVFPTGVTIYNKALAYNTDVIFSPLGDPLPGHTRNTYLINMDGKIVHQWPYSGFPPKMVDPAFFGDQKGVIGVQISYLAPDSKIAEADVVPNQWSHFLDKEFGYVGWNGKILWKWGDKAPDGVALQHHDWDLLKNGNTIILANLKHVVPGFGKKPVLDDVVYEVDKEGQVIWHWSALEHIKQFGFTPAQLKLVESSRSPDILHINDLRPLGPNQWEEKGDMRFAPDNLIFSSRNANFTAIISHKTGDIVWRIGPNYPALRDGGLGPDKLPAPIDQISGQHSAYMIPEGLPGAGDILLLDNQGEAGYPPVPLGLMSGSRVLQINPETRQITWEYNARDSGQIGFSFFTPFIGNVQRLPNGNTLIDEGVDGRIFQVTQSGEIVWEYISPFETEGPGARIPGHPPVTSNWVYRAEAVPAAWLPDEAKAP